MIEPVTRGMLLLREIFFSLPVPIFAFINLILTGEIIRFALRVVHYLVGGDDD